MEFENIDRVAAWPDGFFWAYMVSQTLIIVACTIIPARLYFIAQEGFRVGSRAFSIALKLTFIAVGVTRFVDCLFLINQSFVKMYTISHVMLAGLCIVTTFFVSSRELKKRVSVELVGHLQKEINGHFNPRDDSGNPVIECGVRAGDVVHHS